MPFIATEKYREATAKIMHHRILIKIVNKLHAFIIIIVTGLQPKQRYFSYQHAYVMVILNRVRTYLEAQLLNAQQGFRQQRGTPDALFSLRRMMELAQQYEAPMHAAFVDFSKAFDLVNHRVLWAVRRARGLAPKLVDLIQDLYAESNATGGAQGINSRPFPSYQG